MLFSFHGHEYDIYHVHNNIIILSSQYLSAIVSVMVTGVLGIVSVLHHCSDLCLFCVTRV